MNVLLDKLAFLASSDLSGAEIALNKIPNDDPNGCFVPSVLKQIQEGTAFLCEIKVEHVHVGFTVYSFETFGADYKEFVSIATCTNTQEPLRYRLDDMLCELARHHNCKSLRMHTCRPALIHGALDNGWHIAEIVLRKTL